MTDTVTIAYPTDEQLGLAIARSFGMRTYPIYGQFRIHDAFRVRSRSVPQAYRMVTFNRSTKAVQCDCPGYEYNHICPHAAAVVKRLKRRREY